MNQLKINGAGRAIRRLREEAGCSLTRLAKKLRWNKARLWKYEQNTLGLSLPAMHAIAKALGERPEVVVLQCLKEVYPKLRSRRTKAGRLVKSLIEAIQE